MKGWLVALGISCLLSACAATSPEAPKETEEASTQFWDVTSGKYGEPEQYWVIERRVEPVYPPYAARNRLSGCVNLDAAIGSDGRTKGYIINTSFPKGVFDESAVAAVARWYWQAAEENEKRTPIMTNIHLKYRIGDEKPSKSFKKHCEDTNEQTANKG